MIQEPVFGVDDYEKAYKVLSSQRVLLHMQLNAANPSGDFSTAKRIEITSNGVISGQQHRPCHRVL